MYHSLAIALQPICNRVLLTELHLYISFRVSVLCTFGSDTGFDPSPGNSEVLCLSSFRQWMWCFSRLIERSLRFVSACFSYWTSPQLTHLEVVNVKVRIVGLDEGRAKYRLIVLGCDRLECIDARGAGALRVADHVAEMPRQLSTYKKSRLPVTYAFAGIVKVLPAAVENMIGSPPGLQVL